jgi:hypothetical protein
MKKRTKFITLTAFRVDSYGYETYDKEKARRQFKDLVHMRRAIKQIPGKYAKESANERTPLGSCFSNLAYSIQVTRARARSHNHQVDAIKLVYERGHIRLERTGTRRQAAETLEALREDLRKVRRQAQYLRPRGTRYVRKLGIYAETVGLVHMQKGYWLDMSKQVRSMRIREAKTPKTNKNYVGIELEFCAPLSYEQLAVKLSESGLDDFCHLKGDGSVEPDQRGGYGHEITILAEQDKIHAIIPNVTAALVEHKAYVNKTCGYHVHIDMRNRDARKAFENLRRVQPLLYKMVPKSRKTGRYCKPIRTLNYDSARSSGNRYVGINAQAMREHNTLEIRLHSSTLDPKKILAWVDLLIGVTDSEAIKRTISTPAGLKKTVKAPASLVEYVSQRVKHFSPEHKSRAAQGIEVEAA